MPPGGKVPYLTRRSIVPADAPPTGPNIPDLTNVQGDVYYMFPKRWERFVFFKINNVDNFRKGLDQYYPRVTSSAKTKRDLDNISARPGGKLNFNSNGIGFTKIGLRKLDIRQPLQDPHFDKGSLVLERDELGDSGKYHSAFAENGANHGVFIICSGARDSCLAEWELVKGFFGSSITEVANLEGHVRSDDGEFFGWRDGISQPALEDLGSPRPGQRVVKPGVIILGYPGDPIIEDRTKIQRPPWTKDGSFMVFRLLEQNVLFFEDYIEQNWRSIQANEPGNGRTLTDQERKKLFGARMMGRFKSGVPLALSPYDDDRKYLDPNLINNFDYTEVDGRCPFAAHIRKTAPREVGPWLSKEYVDAAAIVRAGIPYGPEVTPQERVNWGNNNLRQKIFAESPRGLLFSCYQSSIQNGFFRQTTEFANNDFFPPTSLLPKKIGQDPIVGGPKLDKTPQTVYNDQGDLVVTADEARTFYSEDFTFPKSVKDQSKEFEVFMKVRNKNGERFEVAGVAKKLYPHANDVDEQFFVTSRGGDYYFIPPIRTLRSWGETEWNEG